MSAAGAIRPATAADAAAVAALVRTAFAPYAPRIGRAPAPVTADYSALVAGNRVRVLEDEQGCVAALVLWPKDGWLHMETLAVAPRAARRGLGRRMAAFAEDEARWRGLAGLDLYTNAAMIEAAAFYAALGFDEIGRRTEDGFDRIYFRRPLPQSVQARD